MPAGWALGILAFCANSEPDVRREIAKSMNNKNRKIMCICTPKTISISLLQKENRIPRYSPSFFFLAIFQATTTLAADSSSHLSAVLFYSFLAKPLEVKQMFDTWFNWTILHENDPLSQFSVQCRTNMIKWLSHKDLSFVYELRIEHWACLHM